MLRPSSGKEQNTLFTFSVEKPTDSNLWCYFGYALSSGDLFIQDDSTPVFPSSSQTFLTKLNMTQTNQEMFVNCYDPDGNYARATAPVTVIP